MPYFDNFQVFNFQYIANGILLGLQMAMAGVKRPFQTGGQHFPSTGGRMTPLTS